MTKTDIQRIEIFAQKIVEGENQSRAYRAAFPRARNWQDNTVHTRASEFAKRREVLVRVAELKEQALAKHQVTAEQVLSQLVAFSSYDIRYLHDRETNRPLKPWELPEEIKQAVVNVSYHSNGEVREYKMVSKDRAIELLGRYLGLFNGRPEGEGDDLGKPFDPVEAARKICFLLALAEHELELQDAREIDDSD